MGKNIVYMEFGIIHGFRHTLGVLEYSPYGKTATNISGKIA
jgi:hypothetical protein